MQFDNNGNLFPYQVIETDIQTFEHFFVKQFSHSKTRQRLFEAYLGYITEIQNQICPHFYQWLNGSFVTEKLHPADLDIVTFIDSQVYDSKLNELQKFTGSLLKSQKGLDAYFVKVYPPYAPNRYISEFDSAEWQHIFGKNRKRENKGFIQLNL